MNDTYITLTGWVGSDVALREVAGGQPVANFRVASTTRRFRNNEWGDGNTTWYQVKAWRNLADNVARSIKSGDPVMVHGRLEADVWTKEDGTVKTQLVVTATSVGHDLSRGTAVFTKPVRASAGESDGRPVDQLRTGQTNADQTIAGQLGQPADPWAAPFTQPAPAFALDAPAFATEASASGDVPEADAA